MRTWKLKVVVLTAIIILIGVIRLISAATPFLTILCSGFIGSPITRPLHTEGRYIKDDLGNVVYLRGVLAHGFNGDTAGWWHPEGGNAMMGRGVWDPDTVAYNLDKMVELLGANALRFHLNIGWWITNQDNYRQRLRTTCELANERGIYIIMEGFNNGGGGGPGGQSPLPWIPSNSYINSPQDFVDWYLGPNGFPATLSDLPNVIYESWNEPHGTRETMNQFFDACQQIVTGLRARGDDHLFIYQFGYTGLESNSEIPNGMIIQGSNVVYSVHTYRWMVDHYTYFGREDYTYDRVSDVMLNGLHIQNLINADLAWGNFEYGCAITGSMPVPEDERWMEIEWWRNLHRFMNEHHASYTAMQWWDSSRNYALLMDSMVYPWCPPLNEAGEILRDAIAAGKT